MTKAHPPQTQHHACPKPWDVEIDDGTLFLVMERLKNGTPCDALQAAVEEYQHALIDGPALVAKAREKLRRVLGIAIIPRHQQRPRVNGQREDTTTEHCV